MSLNTKLEENSSADQEIASQQPKLTLADAQARVPLLSRVGTDAVKLHRQIQPVRERMEQILARRGKSVPPSIYSEETDHILGLLSQKQEILEKYDSEIRSMGGQLDLFEEAVYFPADSDDVDFYRWSSEEPHSISPYSQSPEDPARPGTTVITN